MSYTFLQEQGEESSAECFSDIPAFVLSRLNLTAARSCSSDSGTESCHYSRYGMMSARSTERHGGEPSMSCVLEYPARRFQLLATEMNEDSLALTITKDSSESFVKWEPQSCSWRTHQHSLFEGLETFSGTWPRWGIMRDGACFRVPMSVAFTYESESGLKLPTTGASEYKGSSAKRFIGSPDFRGAKMSEGLRTCEGDPIYLHPLFAELVMMWPLGWTDCTPLATDKFQRWFDSHGKHSQGTLTRRRERASVLEP